MVAPTKSGPPCFITLTGLPHVWASIQANVELARKILFRAIDISVYPAL